MKKEVKYYGIEIADVEVTSNNCNSITGDKIIGSVSYNPNTKTLILDNAIIDGDIYFGAYSRRIADITITLVGKNIVIGYIGSVSGTKTINGTGSLKVKRYMSGSYEQNTIIEDCTIEIDVGEGNWALFGNKEDNGSKLTIKNANLSSEGEVAIGDFADIELIGCEIVKPANTQIIDKLFLGYAGKYVCDADGNIAKKVVIKSVKNK